MDIQLKYRTDTQKNWRQINMDAYSYFEPLGESEDHYTWDSVPLYLSLKDYIPSQEDEIREVVLIIEDEGKQLQYTKEYYWSSKNLFIHRIEINRELLILQVTGANARKQAIHTLRVNILDNNDKNIEYIKIIDGELQHIESSYSYEFSRAEDLMNGTPYIHSNDRENKNVIKEISTIILENPICSIEFSECLNRFFKKSGWDKNKPIDTFISDNDYSYLHYLSWRDKNNFIKFQDNEVVAFIFSITIPDSEVYAIRLIQNMHTGIITKLEESYC